MTRFEDSDNLSYGSLLGDYFHVVSTIGAMEIELDAADLEQSEAYQRLVERRAVLRKQLDEAARSHANSDITAQLDEAFSDDSNR